MAGNVVVERVPLAHFSDLWVLYPSLSPMRNIVLFHILPRKHRLFPDKSPIGGFLGDLDCMAGKELERRSPCRNWEFGFHAFSAAKSTSVDDSEEGFNQP